MTVSIFLLRALVMTLEQSGASRAELFARIALSPDCLDEPEARLAIDEFEQVLAAAVALTGDEALGLHVAEQMPEMTLDLLAYTTAHAPSFRDAVAIGSKFGSLVIDGVRLATREEGDACVIGCAFPRATPLWDRILGQFTMAGMVRLARAFAGPDIISRLTSFEHEPPRDHREYTRIFGKNITFSQSGTFIVFDREVANRRHFNQNPELYTLLREEAQHRLDRRAQGAGIAARLRQHLLAIPPSRIPDVARAARDLGMSERTLRRHLAAENTSYRDVVQVALEATAGRMLRDPTRSIKEAALALGFGDAPAFITAFKRWTGTTPGEYRRAHRVG